MAGSGYYEVCERKCSECLFTPDRIVSVERMSDVLAACHERANERSFECHKGTIAGRHVVCRGFYDAFPDHDAAMQIAGRLGLVRYVPVPGEPAHD